MIIGVCGTFASGKDTVAEYIQSKGYEHVSTGDLIRQYIRDNNLGETDRDNLRKVANELREEKGAGYLVKEALKKHPDHVVVSGIRATGEVDALFDAGGHLIAVDAPIDKRYQWAKARGRIGDEITYDYFKEQEMAETVNTGHHEQRIMDVIAMAQFDISNEGTLEELHTKIDEILARYEQEPKQ
jgi:dephospho-CoA kinase